MTILETCILWRLRNNSPYLPTYQLSMSPNLPKFHAEGEMFKSRWPYLSIAPKYTHTIFDPEYSKQWGLETRPRLTNFLKLLKLSSQYKLNALLNFTSTLALLHAATMKIHEVLISIAMKITLLTEISPGHFRIDNGCCGIYRLV